VTLCTPLLVGVAALLCASMALAEAPRTTVRPKDTGAALANPGMGWVLHFYDNVPKNYGSRLEPSDTLDDWPGLTVIYLRIPWSYIEPEEGKLNWSVLDSPAQRWVARGRQIALRISCSESWMRYATPEWVEKAGAKGYNFRVGKGVVEDGPFWEPDFGDPVFLEKLDRFLAALAARYDGSPEVAFIDVGSLGVWGEGHTFHSSRRKYSAKVVRRHIDLHVKHFKRTLLAANDDFSFQEGGDANLEYARSKGLTLRDDSICVQPPPRSYFHAQMAQAFWPDRAVILESEHYGPSVRRKAWGDGSLYLKAIEEYHASYASIHWWPHEFLEKNRDLVRRINQRLGYRLQLVEASWPTAVRAQSAWRFAAIWRNAGVAPCYGGGRVAVTLKDARGGVAGVFADQGFDVRSLPVGEPGKAVPRAQDATFALPFNLRPGRYGVYVSVGTATGTPRIALPLPDGDGERRYRLGEIEVTGDYAVEAARMERDGERWRLPLTWTVRRPLPDAVRPFCHFDREGRIQFQGFPEGGDAVERLTRPGTVPLACVFAVPDEARGKTFDVCVGLYDPERMGKPDERMLPDGGEMDRRVLVGTLAVGADGAPTLTLSGNRSKP